MNKKLLFLLCIVINGSSMSLFGMKSESDEEKETSDIYTSDYISWEHHEDSSIVPPEQNNSSKAETPKQKIIIVGDDVFFGEGKPDSLWIRHINEEYQRNIPKTALVNYDVVEDERNINWQSERKKRVEELNKKSEKEQKEKIFEKHDVCIIDEKPYFRPKGTSSWSLIHDIGVPVKFDFNEEQMKKKIDIDGEGFLNEKRYFHHKEKNYWFSPKSPDQHFTNEDFHKKQKEEQEKLAQQKQKNQKSPEQKFLNTNNVKSQTPDKQNPLQEWQHIMQKQINEKELAIKKGLPEPEGQILPKKPTEFDKNQIQKEIDAVLIVDGNQLFHHKKGNFWFDKNMSRQVLDSNFEEKQIEEKIYIDAMHDQEEINNAIKKAQNFQKARNEKTIKQLKEQKEPVDINLKKCETFNPSITNSQENRVHDVSVTFQENSDRYAGILKEKLDLDGQSQQNSDSKTNSQKPWIFRNPNLEKQKNQNEPNNNVVVKNEIAFKDLENSKLVWVENPNEIAVKDLENSQLVWVEDPDKKARSIMREKDFYKDENLIEQAGAKNQRPSEWAYGPDYELKVLNDDINSRKPWVFRNPKKQNDALEKQNEKYLEKYLEEKVYKNVEPAWQENSDDKELWTIIGNKQESRELQPLDSNFINIDAKPLEQNFDSKDNLSLAGHGDLNFQEQDIDSNDNFWELWNRIPKNQEENDNFKLFGYEVFNPNNNSQKKGHSWKDQKFEKEHKKFMHQTTEEWKEELAEKARKQAKKEADERAKKAWLRKLEEAKRTGTEQGTVAYAAHRVAAQKPIGDAFHQGAIAGIEQGTATVVANLILIAAHAMIEKGVEWWNQPNGQELAQLAEKMQLQQFLEALEEGIEKNQKSLENISPVVTTIGNNVERAQLIFEKQLKQKRQELINKINNNDQIKKTIHSELELIKKRNLIKFKQNSAQEREKLIKEFKKKHGISNSPSDEQSKKLDEFLQNLKKDMSQKELQFIDAQEAEYTLEKQQEKYIQEALDILSQASPESKFRAVYDEYNDRILEVLQSQRAMLNAAADNARRALFNGKPAKAA